MRVTILGAGRSGLAAALLAQRNGEHVFVTDASPMEKLAASASTLDQHHIPAEYGGHTDRALQADLLITSPGVPASSPLRQAALAAGIPVIGELEYASRYVENRMVAITGTNGKTTTTALTTHVLVGGGLKAVSCGNIGTPLSSLVGSLEPSTVVVIEASSFQLDTTVDFHPNVSVILNITPDHIGYHGSFESYQQSKWKIFARQRENDLVVLNADDEHVMAATSAIGCTTAFFSTQREVEGAFVRGGEVVFRSSNKEEPLMPVRRLGLPGLHNTYNSMASALASRAFEVSNSSIRDSLSSFAGVEHRLESVRTLSGVKWVNDSKATNINAAWYALASFDHPIVWIAGGRADENDYSLLDELVDTNVRAIVCIGEQADAIFNRWCTSHRCVKAHTMLDAVHIAADLAESSEIVLLSPACKSFDMFSSYEERGKAFKDAVLGL
jgi:UDP-N-acetylmuramoylalanine--D-glutamate ligase